MNHEKRTNYNFSQVHQGAYLIDYLALESSVAVVTPSAQPAPIYRDALDFARAVFIADRFTRRSPRGSTAPRTLDLIVPVRELERWQATEVQKLVPELLNFATQDVWQVEFVQRTVREPNLQQEPIFGSAQAVGSGDVRVSLFSGGLDSVAGAMLRVAHTEDRHVLVSGTGWLLNKQQDGILRAMNGSIAHRQKQKFARAAFFTPIKSDTVHLLSTFFPHMQEEYSERSRGLLFLTMGAVTASSLGIDRLEVYENGVGAINLPFNGASIGADHTRAMHPLHLMHVQRLFTSLFQNSFYVKNPFAFTTKGEMAAALTHSGLERLVPSTVSCEYFATAAHGRKLQVEEHEPGEPVSVLHCGLCTSCLLRRMAMAYGGVAEEDYKEELPLRAVGRQTKDGRWFYLMNLQAEHLRTGLNTHPEQPLYGVLRRYPDLLLAVEGLQDMFPDRPRQTIEAGLAKMYRQYTNEWNLFKNVLLSRPAAA